MTALGDVSSVPAAGLFDAVLGRGRAAVEVADAGWLRAMLEVESALASACAAAGLVPDAAVEAIRRVCADPGLFDVAELAAAAAEAGNPVVPLVRVIEQLAGPVAGSAVHLGATSQDVLDTAMVLVARRSVVHVLDDLRAAADAAAGLAALHRDTAMVARTLLQQAMPTTFGLKAAGWALALDSAAARLATASAALPLQLGGAAGTLSGYSGRAEQVSGMLATALSLPEPVLPWHTARGPLADLAGALGAAGGAVAKAALDVLLLAQGEVGEVREGDGGEAGPVRRGGSSAMPHKHNPVAAVCARAAALRGPGLVATLLTTMAQEHERAAGAWHAEWEAVRDLLRSTGSAAAWLRECLSGLVVDRERMARNLEAAGSELATDAVADALTRELGRAAAQDLVSAAVRRARASGRPLADELADDQRVDPSVARDLLRPSTGEAGRLVDRALAARVRSPDTQEEPA